MKIQWKKLILCVLIPLLVGGLSALLTKVNMQLFDYVNKPPLSPPGWLFPVVWTILYILMGVASYAVLVSEDRVKRRTALFVYGLQLFFNFFWSVIFFNVQNYLFAFIWLVILFALIVLTTALFYRIKNVAGYLLLPYIAWVSFAGYLNYGIYILN